jgi:lysophospholipid acyltransferase (LPLAT)-like uncharacterized protein
MRPSLKRVIARITARVLGLVLAIFVTLWAWSCRRRFIADVRPRLRRQNKPYVYALLHAHQIAAVLASDERDLYAMVSRSRDGDLLVPSLRMRHIRAVRGSSRRAGQDKGGQAALRQLIACNSAGHPVLLAVDGPRGPRGQVKPGVVHLAQATDAVILPLCAVANRFTQLQGTWDKMHLPWPGARITLKFGAPISPGPEASVRYWQQQVETALAELELGVEIAPENQD